VTLPGMQRVVVAVDPSGARGMDDEAADSIGIVVAALGADGRGYVLADRSCKLSPAGWARQAVDSYHEFKADRLAILDVGVGIVDELTDMSEGLSSPIR
jgi:phage terminase large subunit-like protein